MWTWALLLLFAVCEVRSAKFTQGPEAERLCLAYKKICPRGKVCAIQMIQWPRAMKFPVCVHEHAVQVRSRICTQAPSPGQCAASFRRWYYNVHMAACSWFTYGGCGGNDNNFRTRDECEKMCIDSQEESEEAGGRKTDPPPASMVSFIGGDENERADFGQDDREQYGSESYHQRHEDYPTAQGGASSAREAATSSSLYSAANYGVASTRDNGSTFMSYSEDELSKRERKKPSESFSLDDHRHNGNGNGRHGKENGRHHSGADHPLSGVAVQPPSIRTVHIHHRRLGNGMHRYPSVSSPVSLPASQTRAPNLLQAPVRASEFSDFTSGLTSALDGRYAADANETVRRFPPRKRNRGKGRKKKNRRREGQKGEKHNRNRKQQMYHNQKDTRDKHSYNRDLTSNSTDYDDIRNNSDNYNWNRWNDPSRRVMEHKQPKTSFWPEKTQSDEADQKSMTESNEPSRNERPEGSKRKRRRRGRKRKGRRRQRGQRRRSKGTRYYPEEIQLFGLLDKPSNETETPT